MEEKKMYEAMLLSEYPDIIYMRYEGDRDVRRLRERIVGREAPRVREGEGRTPEISPRISPEQRRELGEEAPKTPVIPGKLLADPGPTEPVVTKPRISIKEYLPSKMTRTEMKGMRIGELIEEIGDIYERSESWERHY